MLVVDLVSKSRLKKVKSTHVMTSLYTLQRALFYILLDIRVHSLSFLLILRKTLCCLVRPEIKRLDRFTNTVYPITDQHTISLNFHTGDNLMTLLSISFL